MVEKKSTLASELNKGKEKSLALLCGAFLYLVYSRFNQVPAQT